MDFGKSSGSHQEALIAKLLSVTRVPCVHRMSLTQAPGRVWLDSKAACPSQAGKLGGSGDL